MLIWLVKCTTCKLLHLNRPIVRPFVNELVLTHSSLYNTVVLCLLLRKYTIFTKYILIIATRLNRMHKTQEKNKTWKDSRLKCYGKRRAEGWSQRFMYLTLRSLCSTQFASFHLRRYVSYLFYYFGCWTHIAAIGLAHINWLDSLSSSVHLTRNFIKAFFIWHATVVWFR